MFGLIGWRGPLPFSLDQPPLENRILGIPVRNGFEQILGLAQRFARRIRIQQKVKQLPPVCLIFRRQADGACQIKVRLLSGAVIKSRDFNAREKLVRLTRQIISAREGWVDSESPS